MIRDPSHQISAKGIDNNVHGLSVHSAFSECTLRIMHDQTVVTNAAAFGHPADLPECPGQWATATPVSGRSHNQSLTQPNEPQLRNSHWSKQSPDESILPAEVGSVNALLTRDWTSRVVRKPTVAQLPPLVRHGQLAGFAPGGS